MNFAVARHTASDNRRLNVVATAEHRSTFDKTGFRRGFCGKTVADFIRALAKRGQLLHIHADERERAHPRFLFEVETVRGRARKFCVHFTRALEFEPAVDVEEVFCLCKHFGFLVAHPSHFRDAVLAHNGSADNHREQFGSAEAVHNRLRLFLCSAVNPGDVVHQVVAVLVNGNDALCLRGENNTLYVFGSNACLFDYGFCGNADGFPVVVGVLFDVCGSRIVCRIRFRNGSNDGAVEIYEHGFIGAGANVVRNDVIHILPL